MAFLLKLLLGFKNPQPDSDGSYADPHELILMRQAPISRFGEAGGHYVGIAEHRKMPNEVCENFIFFAPRFSFD